MRFFSLALESDDDDSNKSDDDGSESGLFPSLNVFLCFELSVDRVILLLSSQVLSSRVTIFTVSSFEVSRSKTFLVSVYESLICLW